jgi:hypothetical protein
MRPVRTEANVTTTETISFVAPVDEGNNVTKVLAAIDVPNSAGFARAGWEARYVGVIMLLDFLIGADAGPTASLVQFGDTVDAAYNRDYLWLTIPFPFAWFTALAVNPAFEARYVFVGNDEYERMVRASIGLIAVAAVTSFASTYMSRVYPLIAIPVAWTCHGRTRSGLVSGMSKIGPSPWTC